MTPLKDLLELFITLVSINISLNKPTILKNIPCSPQPDYVETDTLSYFRYTPSMIRLHRCHGANSINDLQYKKCIPNENGTEDVEISVMNIKFQTPLTLSVKNHTACIEKCVIDKTSCSPFQNFLPEDCTCKCGYDRPPDPYPCVDPFRWETSMCSCVCSVDSKECTDGKEFNNRTCRCECKLMAYVQCARKKKVVDENNCQCVDM